MRQAITMAALLLCTGTYSVAAAAEQPSFAVTRPIIVAFFPLKDPSAISEDENESLADFQFYAAELRKPLAEAGIEFHEIYKRSFRIRVRNKTLTFRPRKGEAGYYFIAPGREARIEYGVISDADLLQIAKEYFGTQPPH